MSSSNGTKEDGRTVKLLYWAVGIVPTLICFFYALNAIPLSPEIAAIVHSEQLSLRLPEFIQSRASVGMPINRVIYGLPVQIASFLGGSLADSLYCYFLIILLPSILLSIEICRTNAIATMQKGNPLLAIAIVVAFGVVPFFYCSFGIEEHLMASLLCPYFLLLIARAKGASPGSRVGTIAGVFAVLGLCLKPFFGVSYLVGEALLFGFVRKKKILIRSENIVIISLGILYLLIWIVFFPDFFRELPHAVAAIQSFSPSFELTLTNAFEAMSLPILLTCFVLIYRIFFAQNYLNLEGVLIGLVVILSFAAASIIQLRAYEHHLFPIFLYTLIYFALAFSCIPKALLVLPCCLLLYRIYQIVNFRLFTIGVRSQLIDEMKPVIGGHSVGLLSTTIVPHHTVILHSEAVWQFPMRNLIYLVDEYRDQDKRHVIPELIPSDAWSDTAKYFHEYVLKALEANPPEIMIVRRNFRFPMEHITVDILESLLMDPKFAEYWKDYSKKILSFDDSLSTIELYQREVH